MLKDEHITKLLNLEGIKFCDIDIKGNKVKILVDRLHGLQVCPQCGRPITKIVDITTKTYRDLDLAGRTCYIEVDLKRFECNKCSITFTDQLPFVALHRHYTIRFEQQVYECCRETTATYASLKFGISDKTAAEIYQNIAQRKYEQLQSGLPTRVIGLDEIAMHKGHKNFVVVVTDLTNKRVIDILKDRKKATLEEYINKWSEEFKDAIEFVAIDLWGPYRSVVESILPNAKAVADRFHVMKNLNKALDNCRKKAKEKSINQEIWKNAKYVVLKNHEDLTEEEGKVLGRVLEASGDLKKCYEFKEKFRAIFNDSTDRKTGHMKLSAWILDVVRLEIVEYYGFVKILLRWEKNILNYFNGWVSSGFVEGVNNKIKLIMRKSFGFENFESFRIKVIDCFS